MMQSGFEGRVLWVGVIVLILMVVLLNMPEPSQMVSDPDWAVHLAGAFQIQQGKYPFVDFPSTYGPLMYGMSAIGQILSGNRVIGELILTISGYSLGYILLFKMIKQISRYLVVAGLVLVLALILMPRAYKYFIVLWPVASLFACWLYIDRPSYKSIVIGAFVTTVAGLYRPDLGMYATLGLLATIALENSYPYRQRLTRTFVSLGLIGLFALPFLTWLFVNGGITAYFSTSILRVITKTEGMSLPFPAWNSSLFHSNNLFLISVGIALLVPITTLLASFSNQLSAVEKTKFRIAAIWSQLLLLQAFHRSDYSHFEQAITLTIVSIAALLGFAIYLLQNKRTVLRYIFAIGTLGCFAIFFLASARLSNPLVLFRNRAWSHIDEFVLPVDDFINVVGEDSDNPVVQATYLVHQCTQPGDVIATGPNLINMYFMARRGFRGNMWVAYPQSLTSEDEQKTIQAYEREGKPAVFVYQQGFRYDGRRDRDPSVYLPTLYAYFQENYVIVTKIGLIYIAVPKENAETSPCNTQQLPEPEAIRWSQNSN